MVRDRDGNYDVTLDFVIDDVMLNVDVDTKGNVLGLEIIGASEFFALIGRRGGVLNIPDRIEDQDSFDLEACFHSFEEEPKDDKA